MNRNKPDGLAFVRLDASWIAVGADAVNGMIVRTVRGVEDGWVVEPAPKFIATAGFDVKCRDGLTSGRKGMVMQLTEIADRHLEPLPECGISEEEVRELYAPYPNTVEEQTRVLMESLQGKATS